ncbi:YeeE/YedE family protein [Croceibacter atlanticus]|uniref:YeeE/YedE family protein n=1 Tax=Croceibacter atlanticus TaxID=313588 RepID=UPI002352181D|nr:YeeE/YedE thiosulfate transporter family protein [Croceibacter atlanticus]|tara:strand:- start:709 stop:1266 length:558 start_codon:yes stop_codon:yes gene_type:complete
MDFIYDTWPWYVSGPLIALVMFLLLFAGKSFGMSSNLRTMCSAMGAEKFADFFKFNWKANIWNLTVVLGVVIGGFLASTFFSNNVVTINPVIATQLQEDYNFNSVNSSYLPKEIFSAEALDNPFNILILLIGGLLVGFGARYAGGCTSGHAISGLSNLQTPSLIAVIGFFIGGLLMIHLLFPLIF